MARLTTNLILVWKFILLFFNYELKKSIKKLSKKKKKNKNDWLSQY
jgi:uncharacterized membrane protein